MAEERAEERRAALLNEYSSCQSSVESLDSSVWQSAGIIGLVTIGTFALIAANNPQVYAAIIVGIFSTIGVFAWWRMALRWWSVRDAKIERMRHIEEDLGLRGQTHYIEFMDRLHDDRPSRPVPEDDPEIQKLSRRLGIPIARARELAALEYTRRGPRDALRLFRWVTLIAWIAYVLVRAIGPIWEFVGLKLFVLPIWRWWFFDA